MWLLGILALYDQDDALQDSEQQKLKTVLNEFVVECRNAFSDKLSDVRLYGR